MNSTFNKDIIVNIILLMLVIFGYVLLKLKKTKHKRYIKYASKAINKVNSIENDAQKLIYLRKVNPYVFEEMILTSFEKLGYKIKRNKRYSGDGGIDGYVTINNITYPIQAKRYKNYINSIHVRNFNRLCYFKHSSGFFIHTGKTGQKAKEESNTKVKIISGNKLLNLITGRKNDYITTN